MSKSNKMRVVLVEPGRYARKATIENTLEAEQAVVGGLIDAIRPWPKENVCLVLNDEGKVIPLQPNRGLSEIDDVVYGTFFLCGEDGENFCSLTNEQVERYLARFREPEIICDMPDAIICFPCSPQRYRRYMEGLNIGNGLERPDHRDNPSADVRPSGGRSQGGIFQRAPPVCIFVGSSYRTFGQESMEKYGRSTAPDFLPRGVLCWQKCGIIGETRRKTYEILRQSRRPAAGRRPA